MANREELRAQMIANAAEINRLYTRIHETFGRRSESASAHEEWHLACEEAHARYNQLCIPGGWDEQFFDRVRDGESAAIEAALCFLEVRPYFFRSGYHWKSIFQKCKRAPMSVDQAERYAQIAENYAEWRKFSTERSARGAAVRRHISAILRHFYTRFPARLPDYKFDGIETVGDLYRILCTALKIEPDPQPDRPGGVARGPFTLTTLQAGVEVWSREYNSWRRSKWPPGDVWATLVAIIIEGYGLGSSTVIGPETVLYKPLKQ
jgi:hypothetical protein